MVLLFAGYQWLSAVSLRYLPPGERACVLHNTPGDQTPVQNYPVRSQKCKAAAQTRTSRLVTTALPLRRVAINLQPQQVTVELLVELGKMYLPDAAKAQQAIDQWGVPQASRRSTPHGGHQTPRRTTTLYYTIRHT